MRLVRKGGESTEGLGLGVSASPRSPVHAWDGDEAGLVELCRATCKAPWVRVVGEEGEAWEPVHIGRWGAGGRSGKGRPRPATVERNAEKRARLGAGWRRVGWVRKEEGDV